MTNKVCNNCGKEYKKVPEYWRHCEKCKGRLIEKEKLLSNRNKVERKQRELKREAEMDMRKRGFRNDKL